MPVKRKINQRLFFSALFILLVFAFMLPNLLSKGMFMDGEYYATIARNLARGQGTIWTPVFTGSDLTYFYDNPPLAFWLESLFFRILGDSYLVEKLYSFITFIISSFLIIKIWKYTVGESQYSWLPLILWVLTPLTYWGYVNNLLENTMGLFCLATIVLLLNAWSEKKYKLLFYTIAGIPLSAGLLSKGPVGLFPLAMPVLYWITTRRIKLKEALAATGMLILIPLVIFSILWQYEPARDALYTYFNFQIVQSLKGTNVNIAHIDKYILIKELSNQFIPIFICMGAVILTWQIWFRKYQVERQNRLAIFFLLIAVSATFPMMVSKKQMIHYALCSMPFYAISAALFILPEIRFWVSRINFNGKPFRIIFFTVIFGLTGVIAFSLTRINTNGRDKYVLDDLDIMKAQLPRGKFIDCTGETFYDFKLKAYLYRFYDISLTTYPGVSNYFIAREGDLTRIPSRYKKISIGTSNYFLFKKI